MSRIITEATDIHIGCMYIGSNGNVGLHQATTPQLFLVVSGEGTIRGKEDTEYLIKAGYAAYWEKGEWHETKSEKGLTAIVIEGSKLTLSMKKEEWTKNG